MHNIFVSNYNQFNHEEEFDSSIPLYDCVEFGWVEFGCGVGICSGWVEFGWGVGIGCGSIFE